MKFMEKYKDESYLRHEYVDLGRTISDIAQDHGVRGPSINYLLKKYNIEIRHRGKPYHDIPISKELSYLIDSHMIGDGYISIQKNGHSAAFRLTSKYSDYIDYVNNELKIYGYFDVRKNNGFNINHQGYATCRLETNADRGAMLYLHDEWYKRGIVNGKYRYLKKLPNRDIEIDPHSTMIWFIEDGYYSKSKNGNGKSVGLSTLCYTYDEVSLLRDALVKSSNISDIKIRVSKKIQSWGSGAGIFIENRNNVKDFINFIEPCPNELITCFGYKWGKYL